MSRVTGRLISRVTGRLISRVTGRLTSRVTGRLISRVTGRLMMRTIFRQASGQCIVRCPFLLLALLSSATWDTSSRPTTPELEEKQVEPRSQFQPRLEPAT